MRQDAREICQKGTAADLQTFFARKAQEPQQMRLSTLRQAIIKLCSVIERGAMSAETRAAVDHARESVKIVDASLGLNSDGTLKIKRDY